MELLHAIEAGVTHPVQAELGEIVAGAAAGREREDDITLYESVGIAAQDAAAAALVLAEARTRGRGTAIDL